MSNEDEPTEFERSARKVLRDSADNLDGATRSRLTQARHAALAQAEPDSAWWKLRVIVPGGALAAALLVTLLLWNGRGPALPGSGSTLDDMDLLADAEAYELSQEPDLEFIEWAAAMGDGPTGT
jgi:hypothetical protein